jgi:hypothetical protein
MTFDTIHQALISHAGEHTFEKPDFEPISCSIHLHGYPLGWSCTSLQGRSVRSISFPQTTSIPITFRSMLVRQNPISRSWNVFTSTFGLGGSLVQRTSSFWFSFITKINLLERVWQHSLFRGNYNIAFKLTPEIWVKSDSFLTVRIWRRMISVLLRNVRLWFHFIFIVSKSNIWLTGIAVSIFLNGASRGSCKMVLIFSLIGLTDCGRIWYVERFSGSLLEGNGVIHFSFCNR